MIIIENVGKGMAKIVCFELSEPLFIAFGVSEETTKAPEFRDAGPLLNGIATLAPGDTRKMIWGQYFAIKKFLGSREIRVVCKFERVHGLDDFRELEPVECVLEVKSFAYHDAVDPDGARQCASQLASIAKTLRTQLEGMAVANLKCNCEAL